MRLDPHPLFRKVITPWYDGTTACWMIIVLMLGVVYFGLVGVATAKSEPSFLRHIWVPALLLGMSLFVLLATVRRLVRRYRARHAHAKEH